MVLQRNVDRQLLDPSRLLNARRHDVLEALVDLVEVIRTGLVENDVVVDTDV